MPLNATKIKPKIETENFSPPLENLTATFVNDCLECLRRPAVSLYSYSLLVYSKSALVRSITFLADRTAGYLSKYTMMHLSFEHIIPPMSLEIQISALRTAYGRPLLLLLSHSWLMMQFTFGPPICDVLPGEWPSTVPVPMMMVYSRIPRYFSIDLHKQNDRNIANSCTKPTPMATMITRFRLYIIQSMSAL